MAAVEDLAALAQAHEAVARAALAVAGGAEGGDVAVLHEPADNFIEGALIRHVELLGVVGALVGGVAGVAAHRGTGAAADLGDAQMEQAGADGLALTGGDDHARVGDRQTDAGGDVGEGLVVDAVVELVGIDVGGPLQAGHADGVGADTVDGLQMLGVHDEACELVLVELQTEEDAQAHVVDTALHGAVHGLGVVVVVVLGTRGMEFQVALLVVGLLEQDVSTDPRLLELAVVLYRGGGDVDVDAADIAVLVVHRVDGLDALQNVLDGVVLGILTRLNGQALMAHILEGNDLGAHLLLGQLLAGDLLVLQVVGAVDTAVDAVVGEVQGGEHDDAVAVEGQLDLLGDLVDLLDLLGNIAGQQDGRLAVGESRADVARLGLLGSGLIQNGVDELHVALVGLGPGQCLADLAVVDEFLCFERFGVVVCHGDVPFLRSEITFRSDI